MLYVSVCGQNISTHIPLPLFTPIQVHANTVHTANSWLTCLMKTRTASLHFDEYPPEMRFFVAPVALNLLPAFSRQLSKFSATELKSYA